MIQSNLTASINLTLVGERTEINVRLQPDTELQGAKSYKEFHGNCFDVNTSFYIADKNVAACVCDYPYAGQLSLEYSYYCHAPTEGLKRE